MDLAELVDRTLITDTIHACCDRVGRSDLDALLDLFTDDAELDMGHGATAAGRLELRPFMIARITRWTTTHHQCSTITVARYDGTTASTVSCLYVFHDDPGRDESMHLWGRYLDELVKEQGIWRIRTLPPPSSAERITAGPRRAAGRRPATLRRRAPIRPVEGHFDAARRSAVSRARAALRFRAGPDQEGCPVA